MTQPTTVDMTFDTSLVDLHPNVSFSTTESDPSDFGPPNPPITTPTIHQTSLFDSEETPKASQALPETMLPPAKSSTPVQHIGTQDAYNQWASVYDTDGNMLQDIDDLELQFLLPKFLQKVDASAPSPISYLDLGCGTGRNTYRMLAIASSYDRYCKVTGIDFSPGMLAVAESKLSGLSPEPRERTRFLQADCFPTVNDPNASPIPAIPDFTPFDAVVSTLVLEHIPLQAYFTTLHAILVPRGYALVTNMHSELGQKSQAGFINAEGVKIRGSSFVYTVDETVLAAQKAGFELLSSHERAVTEEDISKGWVSERGRKYMGVKVWYGIELRRMD